MGSGLSSSHRSSASLHQPPATSSPPAALVILADGSLREFAPSSPLLPVSVSDALLGTNADDGRFFFVCSADALYFDADVPVLGADELLRPGQIYFVLPAEMLGRPLSSADMAALAVRASQALAAGAGTPRSGHGGRPRGIGGGFTKTRVVPAARHHGHGDEEVNEKLNQRTLGGFETTTASRSPARASNARKSSTVPARPAHPVRRALSTIEEDAE